MGAINNNCDMGVVGSWMLKQPLMTVPRLSLILKFLCFFRLLCFTKKKLEFLDTLHKPEFVPNSKISPMYYAHYILNYKTFDFFHTKFDHLSYSKIYIKSSLLLSWLYLLIKVIQE